MHPVCLFQLAQKIVLKQMGVLAPGSAHARASAPPHQSEPKLAAFSVCSLAYQYLPQLLKTHIQSLRTF